MIDPYQTVMASSIRGRGRGVKEVNDGLVKKTPKSIEEISRYLHSLDERNINVYGKEFACMVCRYVANNEDKINEVVKLIFDTTVASRDYSTLGCDVCKFIIEYDPTVGSEFLRKLLKHFQTEIKRMKEIRTKSVEEWLGVFAFLCEIYQKIQIGGKVIAVVGKSVLANIEKMIDDPDTIDDEIDVICTKVKGCGKLLEEQDCDSLERIFETLRKQIIAKKSSCQRRCLLMELIELKQLGWDDRTGRVSKFYIDALADAIVEDEVEC